MVTKITSKIIIAISIMLLFVMSSFSLPVESGGSDDIITVNVSTVQRFGQDGAVEKTITLREARDLSEACNDAADSFKVLYSEEGPSDEEWVSEDEKDKAQEIIENAVVMMKELELLPEGQSEAALLQWLFGPSRGFDFLSPVVSCGKGFSWIPFYAGEAFLGVMLRPMFTMYPIMGYTGYLSANLIPPRIQYWDLVGPQVFTTWGFVGIYINFGKILLGVPNTSFMMGYSIFNAGISLL